MVSALLDLAQFIAILASLVLGLLLMIGGIWAALWYVVVGGRRDAAD